ncbi:TonB-linked SusC/RagA family outer membrane protein [Filimonas zeae]|uniref:SusC/RagA family TonB-linked outer membrane protein n=1 Tax=Filimonas zeae TaxID=1737353 RepID=A0A917MWI1_9BACT|nr:SusC/RagA family TonB-linked outer membrane protein [Filimonas zeae]MDR6339147.1 TonB-linked SusC/RagA family outer membrane protein [Filimonas zeae]GGH64898.1 SusC/RagA family TonB-linked outer membrane protein [Filimonas zeae]
MRLSIVLLFVCLQQVSARGYAQKVTLSAKQIPLTQAFNSIKAQTGYSFFWDQQLLDKAPLITVAVKDAPLTVALDKCLNGLNLSYEIKGNIVLIKERKAAGATDDNYTPLQAAPADYVISGKVADREGKPLEGATVILNPLDWKVQTNAKGEFSFKGVPDGRYKVEATYVGYNMGRAYANPANNNAPITITLQPTEQEQEEVVLSTGYQRLKKNSVTGSFAVVTAKDIEQTPSPNIMERLEGKVPGVQFDVRNNKITVRGISTFGTGNSPAPLIVIDGFPYIDQKLTNIQATNFSSGPTSGSINPTSPPQPTYSGNSILSSFNPSDIESITFLKDAAAAAIWGAQAANGVIVVETKKGRKNAPTSVSLNATYSASAPAKLSNLNAMSTTDYVNLERELFDKNFYFDAATNYRYAAQSEAVEIMYRAKRGEITADQREAALAEISGRSNYDQIRDYLLQSVTAQQYNLAVSGGNANGSYHISGNYSRNRPVYKSNYGENYFLNSNTSNNFLNNRLTLNTGLNYTYYKSVMNTAALGALSAGRLGLSPYDMLVDANGNTIQRGLSFTRRVSDSLTRLGHLSWTYNPVDELNYNNTTLTKTALRANVSLTGKITDWLNLQLAGQLQRNIEDQVNLQDLQSLATRELVNTGTVITNGRAVNNVPKGGIYKTSNSSGEDYSMRAQLNFNKGWGGGKHQLTALAATEIRQLKSTGYKQTRFGYDPITSSSATINPTVPYTTMYGYTATLGYSDNAVYKVRQRYLSYLSNATYSYLGRYHATASARFEDYSMLGVRRSQRGTPLWSAGLRWDIAREDFMKDVKWVNNLSVRASTGTGGVIPRDAIAFTVVTLSNDSYTSVPMASINGFANPTLTWQTVKNYNAGIDADLFNSRLAITFDIYRKKSYNIFTRFNFNSTYGFNDISYNTADMSNHGYEFSVTGQVIRRKNWQFISSFNLAYSTNEITDNRYPLNTTGAATTTQLRTGQPVDGLYTYRWAGLNNLGQPQIYNSKDAVINSAGFPTTYAADMIYVGRTTPKVFGGFTNTLQYKSWSLSARMAYYMGYKFLKNEIFNGSYPTSTQLSGRLSTSRALANRWRQPGDEAITNVPGISNANSKTVEWYNLSDISVADGSHIRLQQVTLGYAMPSSMLKKMPVFKAAAINFTAANLGIIWRKNKEGIDPDYVMTNDYNNLPPAVNYSLNLNLTF